MYCADTARYLYNIIMHLNIPNVTNRFLLLFSFLGYPKSAKYPLNMVMHLTIITTFNFAICPLMRRITDNKQLNLHKWIQITTAVVPTHSCVLSKLLSAYALRSYEGYASTGGLSTYI